MSRFTPRLNKVKTKLDVIDAELLSLRQKLQYVRDNGIFKDGGYSTFEEYCDFELKEFGGYARVKQILEGEG